jgi:hypothetical protein
VDFLWVKCVPVGQDDVGSALDLCDPRLSNPRWIFDLSGNAQRVGETGHRAPARYSESKGGRRAIAPNALGTQLHALVGCGDVAWITPPLCRSELIGYDAPDWLLLASAAESGLARITRHRRPDTSAERLRP